MAHPDHIKAQALVELMTGESPYSVAKELGLPLTTVKRWARVDMRQWFREIFGGSNQNGPNITKIDRTAKDSPTPSD